MANRIVIRPEGMRVSIPGVDVLTAAPQQLLFNSDWGGLTVGARGSYYVGYFGDYYIALPRSFPENSLIMAEANGRRLGGCRTVGNTVSFSVFGAGNTSTWRLSLLNASTLYLRHSNFPQADIYGLPDSYAAGPPFPYTLNYAVLDA